MLLTIAIPTYNRANFLDRCLSSITSQIEETNWDSIIQIIVSNNASKDNTSEIVQKYIDRGYKMYYQTHEENIGPDKNFISCYNLAAGDFFWIISDDDFLMDNTLQQVVSILQENRSVGNCYIKSRWFSKEEEIKGLQAEKLIYKITKPDEHYALLNYWITFISGNIVNKRLIGIIDLNELIGSYLIQLSWIVPSIFSGNKNIYVESEVLMCKIQEDRGYPIVKIFCNNLLAVLRKFESKKVGSKLTNKIKNPLFNNFLKQQIPVMIKQNENVIVPVFKEFCFTKSFWVEFLPNYMRLKLRTKNQ